MTDINKKKNKKLIKDSKFKEQNSNPSNIKQNQNEPK